jgi:hypothetical protein
VGTYSRPIARRILARAARVSSTALVRYKGTDYSVPTRYGFQNVLVKAFVDEVVILAGTAEIARHDIGNGGSLAAPAGGL